MSKKSSETPPIVADTGTGTEIDPCIHRAADEIDADPPVELVDPATNGTDPAKGKPSATERLEGLEAKAEEAGKRKAKKIKAKKIKGKKNAKKPKPWGRTPVQAKIFLKQVEEESAGLWITSHVPGLQVKMVTRMTSEIIAAGNNARTVAAQAIDKEREENGRDPMTPKENGTSPEIKWAECDAQLAERFRGLKGWLAPFSEYLEIAIGRGMTTDTDDKHPGVTFVEFTGEEDVDFARDVFWSFAVTDFTGIDDFAHAYNVSCQNSGAAVEMSNALHQLIEKTSAAKK